MRPTHLVHFRASDRMLRVKFVHMIRVGPSRIFMVGLARSKLHAGLATVALLLGMFGLSSKLFQVQANTSQTVEDKYALKKARPACSHCFYNMSLYVVVKSSC